MGIDLTGLSSAGTPSAPTSLLRKVTLSVSWMAVAQVGRRAWSLIVIAVLARLLTPADFGLIALTTLSLGVISMFAETGLTSALIQRADIEEEHLSTAFWLNGGVSVALALLGAALAHPIAVLYGEPRIASLLMVMMLALPFNSLGQVSGALLQKRLAFRQVAAIDVTSALLSGLVAVGLASQGVGVWALVAQSLVMAAAGSLGRVIVARWNPQLLFRRARVRELLGFSLSVLGCSIVNYAVRNIDNALIGGALGTVALGFYSMAYNLVLMPSAAIGGLVVQVMFPALSSIQDDLARLRGAYLRSLRMVSMVAFPLVVGMGATAPLFVETLYGPKWEAVVPLLEILSIIGVLEAINICGVIFFALGRANMMLAWAIVSLVTMTLSFAIGVRWGAVGVAWSYVLVSPIVSVGPHILANRLLSLRLGKFLEALAPGLCASLLMGAVLHFALVYLPLPFVRPGLNLLCLTLVGGLLYALILLAGTALFARSQRLVPWLTGQYLVEVPVSSPAPEAGVPVEIRYVTSGAGLKNSHKSRKPFGDQT